MRTNTFDRLLLVYVMDIAIILGSAFSATFISVGSALMQ